MNPSSHLQKEQFLEWNERDWLLDLFQYVWTSISTTRLILVSLSLWVGTEELDSKLICDSEWICWSTVDSSFWWKVFVGPGLSWNCTVMFTRLLVADIDVESEDDEQGDQGRPPVDDKHHHAAQNCANKRHPHVVVFEAGPPPCDVEQKQTRLISAYKRYNETSHTCDSGVYQESWPGRRETLRNWWERTRPRRSWRWLARWCSAQLHKEQNAGCNTVRRMH